MTVLLYWPACTVYRVPTALKRPRAKSESVACVELLERVSARKLAKCGTLGPKTALKSRPTRRNSPAWGEVKPDLSTNTQGTETGAVFTKRYADPAGGVTAVRPPEASVPV